MSVEATLFLWIILALITFQEHKVISTLKQDLSLLVKEAEIRKKKRKELLQQLIE